MQSSFNVLFFIMFRNKSNVSNDFLLDLRWPETDKFTKSRACQLLISYDKAQID